MIAEPASRLSERPAELQPHTSGFGDRFHYFRGMSGRRYLFTRVRGEDLEDFTDAVVVTAFARADGRFEIRSVGLPGNTGGHGEDASTVVMVHLLAAGEKERRAVLEDLAGVRLPVVPPLRVRPSGAVQRGVSSARWAASRSSVSSRTPMWRSCPTVLTT